ncbi:CheR family methyltransferase [Zhaonella formicivorans]|uniref:CheR family methyltransferase n=1 Tax=Zhaonella formicivorans TaxID=2528593 RepID=UPI0010EEA380|nr:protein-glutamate O-methyltransferase CheR [Zhaonella formicivorans]
MNLEEFEIFQEIIYKKTGILFETKKLYYVERRIKERMKYHNIEDLKSYARMLKYDYESRELETLVNSLTVNETYFFREYEQLKLFAEHILPLLTRRKRERQINVLSAGCSTGDEPYTLAIILNEMLDSDWNYEVVAVDINTDVLNYARAGIYIERAIREVPRVYLEKYFEKNGSSYAVKPMLKEKVTFLHRNLQHGLPDYEQYFDAIFCRNVLIYFDDKSRTAAIENLYRALIPSGYVFLGHSESMGLFSNLFRAEQINSTTVYRR